MIEDTSEARDVDAVGVDEQRHLDELQMLSPGERLALRMELKAQRKKVTSFQTRMICAVANVHYRTVDRWREGRARAAQSKRITDAIRYLNFDIPLED